MISKNLLALYVRDLNKLKEEISLYKNESDLWTLKGEIKNSAGNLALHLIGNLKHFIGTQLGNTGYVRNRDKEFTDKTVTREKMTSEVSETIVVLETVFSNIKDEDLGKEYPVPFLGEKRTVDYLLLALAAHLSYHLGQINYHRRLIGG